MKRNSIASFIFVFASLFIVSSCAKMQTTDLGGSLIPAIDNINTFDTTLDVITDNLVYSDTTRMLYNEATALGVIGTDPEFGTTTATVYSEFTPTAFRSHPFIKKDSVIIDSVILSLAFTKSYGDSNSVQQYEVREINPVTTFTDSLYFLGTADFATRPQVLGTATVHLQQLRKDSVRYKDAGTVVSTINELRIPLDTAFARTFVNYDTADAYHSDSAFKTKFKGLEIRVNEGSSPLKDALAYYNIDDNNRTKITFYCRVVNNGKTDTIATKFTNTTDPRADIIRRTPSGGYLTNTTNGIENDQLLYIQSAPGSYANVKIPGLSTFANAVIHRAELIGEIVPTPPEIYTPPPFLFIEAMSPAGDTAFTIRNDFVRESSVTGYDQLTLGGGLRNNQYILLITRYVQSIITKGFPNSTLRISAPFNAQPFYLAPNTNTPVFQQKVVVNEPVAAGRVVLYGGASTSQKKMRLRIIYSKI